MVGGGHLAFNVLQDLARLALQEPRTKVFWVIRGASLDRILGGGANDMLEERGKLGQTVRQLLNDGGIELFTNIAIDRVTATDNGIVVEAGGQALPAVDEVVVATGCRPKLELLAELRLALDSATQSPIHLAPLIDPNEHSCGTVRPNELVHPDEGVFIVGMKSYGRAPTFLLITGYEQVRSVVAALAGDWDAAKRLNWSCQRWACAVRSSMILTAASVPPTQTAASQVVAPMRLRLPKLRLRQRVLAARGCVQIYMH